MYAVVINGGNLFIWSRLKTELLLIKNLLHVNKAAVLVEASSQCDFGLIYCIQVFFLTFIMKINTRIQMYVMQASN